MAGETINPASFSFHGKEAMALADAVQTPVFKKAPLADVFTIVEGVKALQKVPVLGLMGLVGKADPGCNPESGNQTIPGSEFEYDPKGIFHRQEECYESIKETFFVWATKNGFEQADLTNTEYLMFIQERLIDALADSILRHSWFGDTAAAVIASGGNFTAGTDLDYFNVIDGLWKQGYAIVAGDSTRNSGTLTSKNAEATFADQKFDSTDTTAKLVSTALDATYYDADERLRDLKETGGLVYLVTQTVADQYERELKAATGVTPAWEATQNGLPYLRCNGIAVVAMPFWDRMINTYYKGASTAFKRHLPHRILLTTVENLHLATDKAEFFDKVEVDYLPKERTNIIDAGYNIDAKFTQSILTQFNY